LHYISAAEHLKIKDKMMIYNSVQTHPCLCCSQ